MPVMFHETCLRKDYASHLLSQYEVGYGLAMTKSGDVTHSYCSGSVGGAGIPTHTSCAMDKVMII